MKIFAADIGGTSVKTCITNEQGVILEFKEFDSQAHLGGRNIMKRLISHISEHEEIDGIGISTAGQVDRHTGNIIYANENIPNYTGTKVKRLIEEKFPVPVTVENDVNAAALGELNFGAGRGHSDFLCLTYGTGIGGAIIHNKRMFHGQHGLAGEFGHMKTNAGGRPCNCGGYGCYESYASTTALVRAAHRIDEEITSGRIFFEKWEQGNDQLSNILEEWVNEVAIGMESLIHIFNPGLVIIGGGVMERDDVTAMVNERVKNSVMESFSKLTIKKASLGNRAGLLGAVAMVREKIQQSGGG